MSISTINTQQGHVEEGAGARVRDTSPISSKLLPIHTDTQQEIDQAEQRKVVSRNPETGEVMPVSIATLEGGDGEGVYVSAKQYVALECYPLSAKLTPKAARLVAADLNAAADALKPRKRGKGKRRETSTGQIPAQVVEVSTTADTPLVVDGHVGPAWATGSDLDEGLTSGTYYRDSEVMVAEMAGDGTDTGAKSSPRLYECVGTDGTHGPVHVSPLGTDEMYTVPETRKLAAALTELCAVAEGVESPRVEMGTQIGAMPAWATVRTQEMGASVWTVDASEPATDTTFNTVRPTLSQSDARGTVLSRVPVIFPGHGDAMFTVTEARVLAAGIVELCDKADDARTGR